jgi:ElaB/YqjD/DUF883 family membrane-anchored ribosome-binding protein
MDDTEILHVFPLPEVEQHKLDEVQEEVAHLPVHPTVRIKQQSAVRIVDAFVRANVWKIIGVAAAAGLVCGLECGRRHGKEQLWQS